MKRFLTNAAVTIGLALIVVGVVLQGAPPRVIRA